MKKQQVFERLLDAYVAEKCAHIDDKHKALQAADDIRFAWRKRYNDADDNINSQLKYFRDVKI